MKYLGLLLLVVAFTSCTKHRLDKFNHRIIGSWNLVEINTFGLGNSQIVFNGGSFTFNNDNTAVYYDRNNNTYYGNWFIDAYRTTSTDSDGNTDTDVDFILSINVSNGGTKKYDSFEIPRFGNANRFKAKVHNSLNIVTYVFERR